MVFLSQYWELYEFSLTIYICESEHFRLDFSYSQIFQITLKFLGECICFLYLCQWAPSWWFHCCIESLCFLVECWGTVAHVFQAWLGPFSACLAGNVRPSCLSFLHPAQKFSRFSFKWLVPLILSINVFLSLFPKSSFLARSCASFYLLFMDLQRKLCFVSPWLYLICVIPHTGS